MKILLVEGADKILTTHLPKVNLTIEDAILEAEVIKIEQKAVAIHIRQYRAYVQKLEKRLLGLYKRRSAIEAEVTVGIKKVAPAKPTPPKPKKSIKTHGAANFVASLTQKQVNKLLADIAAVEKKGGGESGE